MKQTTLAILLALITGTGVAAEPDTTKNIFEKGLNKVKLQTARHEFVNGNYQEALDVYEDIYKDNQANPLLNYRLGECNYMMQNYEVTTRYLDKAERLDPSAHRELHLLYARALHRLTEFERAQEQIDKFGKVLEAKKKLKDALSDDKYLQEEYERLKQQIATAQELMKNPVNATITSLGENINSAYDDYRPSISADGSTLIFTSRREGSKGGLMAPDNQYYEDIYISTKGDDGKWAIAEPITGRLNTEGHDASLSIAPEGDRIYVYKNLEGVTKSGDIFYSKLLSSGKWGMTRPLGKTINTTYYESAASITGDEEKIFFVSERKNGIGQGDIYMSKKISRRDYGEAVNLGETINTIYDENNVWVNPEGTIMIFSSDGHESMGGYDIFISKYEGGKWTKPKNVGYPINTVDDDVHFTITADGKTAYYAKLDREKGMGKNDIYKIDLSSYNIFE